MLLNKFIDIQAGLLEVENLLFGLRGLGNAIPLHILSLIGISNIWHHGYEFHRWNNYT